MSHCLRVAFLVPFLHLAALAQSPLLVPENFPDIGSAIQAAAPGAVIRVGPRVPPYPPFTIDRPVTIVGTAGEQSAPIVRVAAGAGITVQLTTGQRAVLSRIDVVAANGATSTQAVTASGGHVTLEDCRFFAVDASPGAPAAVEVVDTDLTMVFARVELGTATAALRATRSRVALVSTRCFGANPDGTGVIVQDSTLQADDAWLLGGENALGGAGGAALVVRGASQVWMTGSELRSGMGAPAGSAIVNTTSVPVELRGTTPTLGLSLGGVPAPPVVIGPVATNPGLIGLRWGQQLYRNGTLLLGQPFGLVANGPAVAPILVALSLGPTRTATVLTLQPAMDPAEIALLLALVTDGSGDAVVTGNVPNNPVLVGVGLWAQALGGGTGFPLAASPHAGVVVRP